MRDERDARALEIIRRRAERAARASRCTSTCFATARRPAYCGWSRRTTNVERDELAAVGIEPHPSRVVRADDHFAPPEEMQLVEGQRRRKPQRDAAARAAAIEAEHEPRLRRRAARRKRPQAEAAMQPAQRRRPHLGDGEQRIPQQRPVREHPPAGALGPLRERVGQRRRQLLVVERASGIDRREVDLAHPALLEIAAAQRVGVLSASVSFDRIRVARELAELDLRLPALRGGRSCRAHRPCA